MSVYSVFGVQFVFFFLALFSSVSNSQKPNSRITDQSPLDCSPTSRLFLSRYLHDSTPLASPFPLQSLKNSHLHALPLLTIADRCSRGSPPLFPPSPWATMSPSSTASPSLLLHPRRRRLPLPPPVCPLLFPPLPALGAPFPTAAAFPTALATSHQASTVAAVRSPLVRFTKKLN